MWYYTYVLYLYNRQGFYVGCTTSLNRRLLEHKQGKVKSTKTIVKKPELIFYEVYKSSIDARRRERYLKSSKGKKVLRQMLVDTLKNFEFKQL